MKKGDKQGVNTRDGTIARLVSREASTGFKCEKNGKWKNGKLKKWEAGKRRVQKGQERTWQCKVWHEKGYMVVQNSSSYKNNRKKGWLSKTWVIFTASSGFSIARQTSACTCKDGTGLKLSVPGRQEWWGGGHWRGGDPK